MAALVCRGLADRQPASAPASGSSKGGGDGHLQRSRRGGAVGAPVRQHSGGCCGAGPHSCRGVSAADAGGSTLPGPRLLHFETIYPCCSPNSPALGKPLALCDLQSMLLGIMLPSTLLPCGIQYSPNSESVFASRWPSQGLREPRRAMTQVYGCP